MRGAPEWLAVLGHGGREVVPADICVQAVGAEVRWWCSSSLLFDGCAVSAPLRWRGRVAGSGHSCSSTGVSLRCRGSIAGMHRATFRQRRCGGGEDDVCYCLSVGVRKVRCCPGESLHRHSCRL